MNRQASKRAIDFAILCVFRAKERLERPNECFDLLEKFTVQRARKVVSEMKEKYRWNVSTHRLGQIIVSRIIIHHRYLSQQFQDFVTFDRIFCV